jgi:hypothetical protein
MVLAEMVIFSKIWGETIQSLLDRTQPFMSVFDEHQVWYLGAFKNVDPGPTATYI